MIKHKSAKQAAAFFFLPFAICVLLFSCKDKLDTYNIDYKYGYLPMDTGKYITYNVDSIFSYNSSFTRDTVSYQLKELVADTFYDADNELSYRLELYRRPNSNASWTLDRVWYQKKTIYNAQKIEDDIRFIKLVFPPEQDKTWNGNNYIPSANDPFRSFANWIYTYQSVDVPYTINGFSFDSSLTVVAVNDSSFVDKRLRKEVYAKGIGMVYQEWELKNKQQLGSWDTGKWNGFSIRMRLIDHN